MFIYIICIKLKGVNKMKIQRLSKELNQACILIEFFIILLWSIAFLKIAFGINSESIPLPYSKDMDWESVSIFTRWAMLIFITLSAAIMAWGVDNLRKLFKAYSQSVYFSSDNIKRMKNFSLSLIIPSFFGLIPDNALDYLYNTNLTWKDLSYEIDGSNLVVFLAGLVFWLISKVLLEATLLQQENNEFV
jgi:hypothetical protein